MLVEGESGIALFPAREGADAEPGIRILHIGFRVDRANFEAAQESLRDREIPVRFSDHGVSHSIYFEDPDGHQLELTTYEL
jgi:catechol-2,3-dioxygenase